MNIGHFLIIEVVMLVQITIVHPISSYRFIEIL
jgi:hypothetical protein